MTPSVDRSLERWLSKSPRVAKIALAPSVDRSLERWLSNSPRVAKVALITPYYTESVDLLRRCHESVASQTYPGVTHIMVADGHPNNVVDEWDCEHLKLPESHRDSGATPRAVAALSAFGRGYDAVGFIDADNSVDPDHVACMVAVAT